MDIRPQSSDELDSQRRVRRDMSNSLKGTLLTVVAGIAWGLSGTSGQYLMAHGISALVLTNLRLLIAGGILMLLAYATAKDKILVFLKDRKSLLSLLIFALIGLFSTNSPICLLFRRPMREQRRCFSMFVLSEF